MNLSPGVPAGLVLALLGIGNALAVPEASEPWLEGAFVAEAPEVARAAARTDAGIDADAVMLLRDDRFRFDADGRMTYTRRWVYRVLTPVGLEDWSATEVHWAPWHQARPSLRVRIVDPDGGERWLDPGSVSELTAAQAGLEGHLRLLRAPLRLAVGAVVEEQVIVRDVEPLFAAGTSRKHLLAMPVPIHRGRLTLEAPASLPLRYAIRRMPPASSREVASGEGVRERVIGERTEVTFEYADLPAARPIEVGLPADEPRHPHLAFSTGGSWSSVAAAYGRAVEARLTASETEAVRRWLPNRGASTRLGRTVDVVEGLRGNVRLESSEVGASPLLPPSPLATLKHGAGDSKDLAVVLVAALRAEGILAQVALLRAGYGMDVEPQLPGLGRFNHALVYLPGESLWIAPGDPFSRVGELASNLQGRLALVASPETRQLVRTPVASSGDNRTITEIDVYMADIGPARVIESGTYFGAAEHRQRLVSSQLAESGRRDGYQAYLEAAYRAEALGAVAETAATDLSVPFRLRLEGLKAGRAWTTVDEGALAIELSQLITMLPRELLVDDGERRQRDFVFHEPFMAEWRYRIHPPARMAVRALPEDAAHSLGSGRLTRIFSLEGSVVHAKFRLDSGPRRITADRFHAFRAAVREQLQAQTLVLWFDRRD